MLYCSVALRLRLLESWQSVLCVAAGLHKGHLFRKLHKRTQNTNNPFVHGRHGRLTLTRRVTLAMPPSMRCSNFIVHGLFALCLRVLNTPLFHISILGKAQAGKGFARSINQFGHRHRHRHRNMRKCNKIIKRIV